MEFRRVLFRSRKNRLACYCQCGWMPQTSIRRMDMNHKRLQPKRVFGLSNVLRAGMAALALAFLVGMTAPQALAFRGVTPPPTPPAITPPAGNTAYLMGHATGT